MALYASRCCGAVFSHGHGTRNIVPHQPDHEHEPGEEHDHPDARRLGPCPACGVREPFLDGLAPRDLLGDIGAAFLSGGGGGDDGPD